MHHGARHTYRVAADLGEDGRTHWALWEAIPPFQTCRRESQTQQHLPCTHDEGIWATAKVLLDGLPAAETEKSPLSTLPMRMGSRELPFAYWASWARREALKNGLSPISHDPDGQHEAASRFERHHRDRVLMPTLASLNEALLRSQSGPCAR